MPLDVNSSVSVSPDLLDIMGTYMYDQKSGEFKLRAGPLFSNILLADEINRAPPKTQALLKQWKKSKLLSKVLHINFLPFRRIGNSNPIEQEGTYARV